jgi:hypothetical protein
MFDPVKAGGWPKAACPQQDGFSQSNVNGRHAGLFRPIVAIEHGAILHRRAEVQPGHRQTLVRLARFEPFVSHPPERDRPVQSFDPLRRRSHPRWRSIGTRTSRTSGREQRVVATDADRHPSFSRLCVNRHQTRDSRQAPQ